MIIKIDPEFQRRIPKLRPDELELLRKSLLEDGCLEPITTWPVKGDDIIIDGHNRFRICEKEGITFATNRIEFADRDEALLWIDRHQLGRRNLNDTQRTVIANRVAERLVSLNKKQRTDAANDVLDASSKTHRTNTREEVAKEANVPVRKLREVQEVVRVKPELEEKLLSGEVSLLAARKEIRDEQGPPKAASVSDCSKLGEDAALAWGTLFYITDKKAGCRNLSLMIDIIENLYTEIGGQRLVEYAKHCWKRYQTPDATDCVTPEPRKYNLKTRIRVENLHKQISESRNSSERKRLIQKLLSVPTALRSPDAFPTLGCPRMVTKKELRRLEGKRR